MTSPEDTVIEVANQWVRAQRIERNARAGRGDPDPSVLKVPYDLFRGLLLINERNNAKLGIPPGDSLVFRGIPIEITDGE